MMKNEANTSAASDSRTNAWIAVDNGVGACRRFAPYILALMGERALFQAIDEDDWVLVLSPAGDITRVGRVLRIRSDLVTTTLYFDRLLSVIEPVSIGITSLTLPTSGNVGRVQWTDFVEALPKAAYSGPCRPPVPKPVGPAFRMMSGHRSGPCRVTIPEPVGP